MMRKGKAGRGLIAALLMLALVFVLSSESRVSANSPEPSPSVLFVLSNLPEGTVYVDLLIHLAEQDECYVDTIRENIPKGFAHDAGILTWCEDDYRSYTFHYRDALSILRVDAKGRVRFFEGIVGDEVPQETFRLDHADEILPRGEIRLAMLDSEGNILEVSPLLDLRPRTLFAYVSHVYHYDATSHRLEPQDEMSAFAFILYIILCLLGMVLTCFVELCVALPFKLVDRYGRLIGKTNVISQTLMHASYLALYSLVFWRYTYATILLEILVFVGEFLYYRKKMQDISRIRCLSYTIAANASSLIIGLRLMNMARS